MELTTLKLISGQQRINICPNPRHTKLFMYSLTSQPFIHSFIYSKAIFFYCLPGISSAKDTTTQKKTNILTSQRLHSRGKTVCICSDVFSLWNFSQKPSNNIIHCIVCNQRILHLPINGKTCSSLCECKGGCIVNLTSLVTQSNLTG